VVQRFVMWADGVPMEAKILPAAEARTIYEEYVRRQQDPALLEYVGRDAVQARIFPIPAGAERRIELEYTQALAAENGLLHYRYPLNTERFSAQPLEQLYISVEIRSQTPLRALYSPSHQEQLLIQREGDTHATVSYEAQHVYPDRDFELFIGLGEDTIGANLLTYRQGTEDGFFLLMLTPAFDLDAAHILPKDVLLIQDCSESITRTKLDFFKEGILDYLRTLTTADRINLMRYSETPDLCFENWQPVTAESLDQAVRFTGAMRARGQLRNVEGEIPLAETHGYATELRSMTQGRGTFTLEFKRYEIVPDSIAEDVIKARKAAGKIPER